VSAEQSLDLQLVGTGGWPPANAVVDEGASQLEMVSLDGLVPLTPGSKTGGGRTSTPSSAGSMGGSTSSGGGGYWVEEEGDPVELCGGGDQYGNSWTVPC